MWLVRLWILVATVCWSVLGHASCQSNKAENLGRGFHLGEVFGHTKSDFESIAKSGGKLVRFGINLKACPGCSRYEWPKAGIEELFQILESAQKYDLKVVLVLRPPPEQNSELWSNPMLQKSVGDIWRWLAEQLKGRREVAAFDLVNEPHPSGTSFTEKEHKWEEFASRLISTIREKDPERTVVFEPSPGARPMAFNYVRKLDFENVIYSAHFYEPFEFTHQRIGDPRFIQVVDYPGKVSGLGTWNSDRLKHELDPIQAFQKAANVKIYIGEFGAIRWSPVGSRDRYFSDLISLFNMYDWSWTYHAYREWHGWDSEMGPVEAIRQRSSNASAYQILIKGFSGCSNAD